MTAAEQKLVNDTTAAVRDLSALLQNCKTNKITLKLAVDVEQQGGTIQQQHVISKLDITKITQVNNINIP